MPLTTEEAIRRYAYQLSGAGADPAGAEAPALSVGPARRGRAPRRFRWARRALICWRSSSGSAAGGSRCSRSIRTTRRCSPGPASTRWFAGSSCGGRKSRSSPEREYGRYRSAAAAARPSARRGPELVSNHEPRRRPGDAAPGAHASQRRAASTCQPGWACRRLTRTPTKPS